MRQSQTLIAGLLCSAVAITLVVTGAPMLLAVLILGIGIGLKIAYLFVLP